MSTRISSIVIAALAGATLLGTLAPASADSTSRNRYTHTRSGARYGSYDYYRHRYNHGYPAFGGGYGPGYGYGYGSGYFPNRGYYGPY